MIRYIKQRLFSIGDTYQVKDETGAECYYAYEQFPRWRRRMIICNSAHEEVARVQAKGFILYPSYSVSVNGTEVVRVRKKYQVFGREFELLHWPWDVECSPFAYEYTVSFNDTPAIFVNKKLISWGDFYRVEIDDSVDELVAVSIALAVDFAIGGRSGWGYVNAVSG